MRPFDDLARLDRAQILDRPVTAVRDVVQRVLANRTVADALHGVWLGHPLHPALAQVALGSFLSASLLDALPGRRERVRRPHRDRPGRDPAHRDQRVGRLGGRPRGPAADRAGARGQQRHRGRALPRRPAPAAAAAVPGGRCRWPAGWSPASARCWAGTWATGRRSARTTRRTSRTSGPSSGRPRPARRAARRTPGAPHGRARCRCSCCAAAPTSPCCRTGARTCRRRCPTASWSATGADTRVVCPWHASEFRVDDGCVVHGPATAPAPRFESRVTDGVVQARVVTIPGVPAS